MRSSFSIVASLVVALGLSASASAVLDVQSFWTMGEDGQINPTDSAGSVTINDGFNRSVSTTAFAPGGSTSSLFYNGSGGSYINGSGSYLNVPTDNWVVELWFNQTARTGTSEVNLVSLGVDDGHAKIGLSQPGTVYFGREGQSYGPASGTPLELNTWHHAAFVQMDGKIHGFLDGVEVGAFDNDAASTGNNGAVHLGVKPGNGQNLEGYLDNVRFSTFAAGGFDKNDLLYYQAVPEPATMAALGFGALAMLKRRRRS